jgi:hypothetical protein
MIWLNKGSVRIEESIMPAKKNGIPRLHAPKNATMRQIYAAYRKQFTAADLQRYTEIEPMVTAEQLIKELEAIHREETGKRKKKQGL